MIHLLDDSLSANSQNAFVNVPSYDYCARCDPQQNLIPSDCSGMGMMSLAGYASLEADIPGQLTDLVGFLEKLDFRKDQVDLGKLEALATALAGKSPALSRLSGVEKHSGRFHKCAERVDRGQDCRSQNEIEPAPPRSHNGLAEGSGVGSRHRLQDVHRNQRQRLQSGRNADQVIRLLRSRILIISAKHSVARDGQTRRSNREDRKVGRETQRIPRPVHHLLNVTLCLLG